MWPKGRIIDDAFVIGVEGGGHYKLKWHTDSALIASTISPCELWHKILAHVNYKALPIVIKVVTCLPVGALKIVGSNSKEFSPINVPN